MSRPARNSWRFRSAAAIAMLLPMLALGACSNHNEQEMAAKLAAAEAAAAKAVEAQKAAENAALLASTARPAPAPSPDPVMTADGEPSFDPNNPPHGGMSPDETDFDFQNGTTGQGA